LRVLAPLEIQIRVDQIDLLIKFGTLFEAFFQLVMLVLLNVGHADFLAKVRVDQIFDVIHTRFDFLDFLVALAHATLDFADFGLKEKQDIAKSDLKI
jgi:hypothetical protein